MKKVFYTDIERATLENTNYREVLHTDNKLQIVVMSLQPNEDIPKECHTDVVQFIRIEEGEGYAEIDGEKYNLKDGNVIVIPKNEWHYVKNTSKTKDLKLYSIYVPPEHPKNKIDKRQPN